MKVSTNRARPAKISTLIFSPAAFAYWLAMKAAMVLEFAEEITSQLITAPVVSTFVSGPSYEILPLRIYSMVRVGLKPEVNALGTLLLVFSLFMLMLSQWILIRSKR